MLKRYILFLKKHPLITAIELFIFWMIYRRIGKKIDYRKIREEW